jgi:predicted ester cyclase
MSAENKALIERWFEEVWNKGRGEAIDEMFAPDGVAHGLGPDLRGPAEFKTFHAAFRQAFPDVRVAVDDLVAEGDTVAYRLTASGTHLGHGLGFAPTSRPARFVVMGTARIANGRIVEGWNVMDNMGMLTQLGVVTPP